MLNESVKPLPSTPSSNSQWWAWFVPAILYTGLRFSPLAEGGSIYWSILVVALGNVVLPGIIIGLAKWWLCRKSGIVQKSRTTLVITLGFAALVAINVLLGDTAQLSLGNEIDATNSVTADKFIFAFLLIVFSANLGLAIAYLSALFGIRFQHWLKHRDAKRRYLIQIGRR